MSISLRSVCHSCGGEETAKNILFPVGMDEEFGLYCEYCVDEAEFVYKETKLEELHSFLNSPSW